MTEQQTPVKWPTTGVQNLNVQLNLTLTDVGTIGEGMDKFTQILGRFGVDDLALILTDVDTEQQWILEGGVLMSVPEWEAARAIDAMYDPDEEDEEDEDTQLFEVIGDTSDHQLPMGAKVFKVDPPAYAAPDDPDTWYSQGGDDDEVSIHPDDLKPVDDD